MSNETATNPVSWAPEVHVEGKWSRNQVRFATKAEAEQYAHDLFMRWTSTNDHRATEATEPVNYALVGGTLVAVPGGGAS